MNCFLTSRAWAAVLILCGAPALAQPWKPLLNADRAIDWLSAGVGPIPTRAQHCAELGPESTLAQINTALAACPADRAVLLKPGTYTITGTIHVPTNVTLRGSGADQTILNATGTGEAVISMGGGSVPLQPRVIREGATAGSTELVFGATTGIAPGKYLAISEANDPAFVTSAGSGGNCNWCDGGWSKDGSFARGQIVAVTAVNGNRVTITPGLYGAYTHAPFAVPFNMAVERAGVEDLQVRANKTGHETNFAMRLCAYCWLRGVEGNYADGDHVSVFWGFHDEIRDSYFSNAYVHLPGAHDSDIQLALKTSASLVENNIIERTHTAVMLEWGAAGNVIAYNYTMGEFDSESPGVVIGGVDFHGAHPQYTLIEGNVMTALYADSVWGSSSHTTAFRNWIVGTNRICSPMIGRGAVNCSGTNAHYGWQAARAVQWSYLATRNNMVGNVVGSEAMQSVTFYGGRSLRQIPSLEYPAERPYEAAVGWTFGYGSANDDGSGTGCGGGKPPCHAEGTSATDLLHGNYNNISRTVNWIPGAPKALPASFYLPGQPVWWIGLPFPAIGPDVRSGPGQTGHAYGNPAQACYAKTMGGVDGGAGSPLKFNRERCYCRVQSPAANPTRVAGPGR